MRLPSSLLYFNTHTLRIQIDKNIDIKPKNLWKISTGIAFQFDFSWDDLIATCISKEEVDVTPLHNSLDQK